MSDRPAPLAPPGPAWRAWLDLLRVSNLPTVWSNVLVGTALAAGGGTLAWSTAALVALAISLFYLAGMALNDLCDLAVDRLERPHRPIPAGRIPAWHALLFVILALAVGLTILTRTREPAALLGLVLGGLVVLYNLVHRDWPDSVWIMGLCRGVIYPLAAVAVCPVCGWVALGFAAVLVAYVVVLSRIARHETGDPRRISTVLRLLAGISLLDAAFLVVLGQWLAAGVAVGCFLLTRRLHRRVRGT